MEKEIEINGIKYVPKNRNNNKMKFTGKRTEKIPKHILDTLQERLKEVEEGKVLTTEQLRKQLFGKSKETEKGSP